MLVYFIKVYVMIKEYWTETSAENGGSVAWFNIFSWINKFSLKKKKVYSFLSNKNFLKIQCSELNFDWVREIKAVWAAENREGNGEKETGVPSAALLAGLLSIFFSVYLKQGDLSATLQVQNPSVLALKKL